jgi:hypothetical protein
MQTVKASRWMLSPRPPRSSESPRENPSKHQNGQKTTDYSVSASMYQKIWSYIVALHHSITTPKLQGTLNVGKPWSLYQGTTGGDRCLAMSVSTQGHAISAFRQRSNVVAQLENFITPHTREPLGHHRHRLHWRAPRCTWTQCYHECGRLNGETSLWNIWKLPCLLCSIASDWGLQFMAEFTQELYRLLGITLSTTTAYHPQADG